MATQKIDHLELSFDKANCMCYCPLLVISKMKNGELIDCGIH